MPHPADLEYSVYTEFPIFVCDQAIFLKNIVIFLNTSFPSCSYTFSKSYLPSIPIFIFSLSFCKKPSISLVIFCCRVSRVQFTLKKQSTELGIPVSIPLQLSFEITVFSIPFYLLYGMLLLTPSISFMVVILGSKICFLNFSSTLN